jgi:hypothetical protein
MLTDPGPSHSLQGLSKILQHRPLRTDLMASQQFDDPVCHQIPLTSPPSIRTELPVIHFDPGATRNAINSAISSGSP